MHFLFKLTKLKPSRFYPIHLKGEAITSIHFEDSFKRPGRTGWAAYWNTVSIQTPGQYTNGQRDECMERTRSRKGFWIEVRLRGNNRATDKGLNKEKRIAGNKGRHSYEIMDNVPIVSKDHSVESKNGLMTVMRIWKGKEKKRRIFVLTKIQIRTETGTVVKSDSHYTEKRQKERKKIGQLESGRVWTKWPNTPAA